MQAEAYLKRIGYRGSSSSTPETLRQIHRAHMMSVPFENLDIHLAVPIALSVPAFYKKIVERRRGGFCYELNGLFAWLLAELGFEVTLLSARVFSQGRFSAEFDHMLLLVELDKPWIADVGFGDSFLQPLQLDPQKIVEQQGRRYSILKAGQEWTMRQREPEGAWVPQYRFSLVPRRLEDFAARCIYQQTSPESHFTQKTVCSLATQQGRITLSNGRYIRTEGGEREEREVESSEEYRAILADHFQMDVHGLDINRLMGRSPRSTDRQPSAERTRRKPAPEAPR